MQKVFLLNRRDKSQCPSVAKWTVTSVFQKCCGVFFMVSYSSLQVALLHVPLMRRELLLSPYGEAVTPFGVCSMGPANTSDYGKKYYNENH